jgi:hypothetical protein
MYKCTNRREQTQRTVERPAWTAGKATLDKQFASLYSDDVCPSIFSLLAKNYCLKIVKFLHLLIKIIENLNFHLSKLTCVIVITNVSRYIHTTTNGNDHSSHLQKHLII